MGQFFTEDSFNFEIVEITRKLSRTRLKLNAQIKKFQKQISLFKDWTEILISEEIPVKLRLGIFPDPISFCPIRFEAYARVQKKFFQIKFEKSDRIKNLQLLSKKFQNLSIATDIVKDVNDFMNIVNISYSHKRKEYSKKKRLDNLEAMDIIQRECAFFLTPTIDGVKKRVGTLGVRFKDNGCLEIVALSVHPKYQGMGLSKICINELFLHVLKNENAKKICWGIYCEAIGPLGKVYNRMFGFKKVKNERFVTDKHKKLLFLYVIFADKGEMVEEDYDSKKLCEMEMEDILIAVESEKKEREEISSVVNEIIIKVESDVREMETDKRNRELIKLVVNDAIKNVQDIVDDKKKKKKCLIQ